MPSKDFLSATEAAAELGVSVATLYSYVSRGMLRSEEDDAAKRSRRYPVEDVRRLRQRRDLRHDPEQGVGDALHWGLPVLESALTLVEGGRCYYRGRDVVDLARIHTLESVAAFFWTGDFEREPLLFPAHPSPLSPVLQSLRAAQPGAEPTELFLSLLPAAGEEDAAAWELSPEQVPRTGARVVQIMAALASGRDTIGDVSAARSLARAWNLDEGAERLLNAALVLCVDHELSISSFTARCVASAGATPYHVVLGGLSAFQGIKHGGATRRVEALMRECAGTPEQARAALRARLRRGEAIVGFGHHLYPEGDPRGRFLLELAREAAPDSAAWALADAVAWEAHVLLGEHPNIDFGLAALCLALGLPPGSALTLFEMGRAVGCIGHAIEEYRADKLIRPRARYSGPKPELQIE